MRVLEQQLAITADGGLELVDWRHLANGADHIISTSVDNLDEVQAKRDPGDTAVELRVRRHAWELAQVKLEDGGGTRILEVWVEVRT